MVEFIHKLTGSLIYVDESRVNEYIAAGHTPAADLNKKVKPPKPPKQGKATKAKNETPKEE